MTNRPTVRSPLPEISENERKKPLCYDPARKKFILYDEIIDGREPIFPVEELSEEDAARLVIERNLKGPDYAMQIMSGAKYTRDDVVREIGKGTSFGRTAVAAEQSYLSELLHQIKEAIGD
jgi:hypothetical protein